MNRALIKSVGLGGAVLGAGALGGTLLSKLVQKGVDLTDRKKQ
jgi:ketopantoate reductase